MHKNKINGKVYIGLTGQSVEDRWQGGRHYKTCPAFNRAINKYGWDNFEHIIIAEHLSKKDACSLEQQLIKQYRAQEHDFGYNIANGGQDGSVSEAIKAKLSFVATNIRDNSVYRTEEFKTKISAVTKGDKNPRARMVLCLTNGKIFTTAKEAAEWCHRDKSGLCKAAKGDQAYCGIDPETGEKLRWIYIDSPDDAEELLIN